MGATQKHITLTASIVKNVPYPYSQKWKAVSGWMCELCPELERTEEPQATASINVSPNAQLYFLELLHIWLQWCHRDAHFLTLVYVTLIGTCVIDDQFASLVWFNLTFGAEMTQTWLGQFNLGNGTIWFWREMNGLQNHYLRCHIFNHVRVCHW